MVQTQNTTHTHHLYRYSHLAAASAAAVRYWYSLWLLRINHNHSWHSQSTCRARQSQLVAAVECWNSVVVHNQIHCHISYRNPIRTSSSVDMHSIKKSSTSSATIYLKCKHPLKSLYVTFHDDLTCLFSCVRPQLCLYAHSRLKFVDFHSHEIRVEDYVYCLDWRNVKWRKWEGKWVNQKFVLNCIVESCESCSGAIYLFLFSFSQVEGGSRWLSESEMEHRTVRWDMPEICSLWIWIWCWDNDDDEKDKLWVVYLIHLIVVFVAPNRFVVVLCRFCCCCLAVV